MQLLLRNCRKIESITVFWSYFCLMFALLTSNNIEYACIFSLVSHLASRLDSIFIKLFRQ